MINKRKALFAFLFLIIGFMLVLARLIFIQIWEHDNLEKKVNKISFRSRADSSYRGTIFDRYGRPLAVSAKTYVFFADPTIVKKADELKNKLKEIGITVKIDKNIWDSGTAFVPLLERLSLKNMQRIKELDIKGTGFKVDYVRKYPEDRLACHLIGIVGYDGRGLEGIEFVRDKDLYCLEQTRFCYRDGKGRELIKEFIGEKSGGLDIHLTIDRNLQYIAEKELDTALERLDAKNAAIIIQNPKNGDILAMASRPSFDPTNFSKSGENLKNYAISSAFEPGSTFKIVAAAAVLEENLVKLDEKIFCENGKYKIYGHTIEDHRKKDYLDIYEIIQYSSNIGMAKFGERLGKDKLYKYIRQFGFYTKTGLKLPGEARGLLQPVKKWSGLSVDIVPFGQEIGTTAIQITNAYSVIANGGELLKPRVIMLKADNENKKKVIRRVISPEVAKNIGDMLLGVVDEGTGQRAQIPGYSVGGKTGTAQKKDPFTQNYSSTSYVSSFCGILPMSDPQLTIFVVFDEPKNDYWGASTAAPVFKNVAVKAIRYLEIPPDRDTVKFYNIQESLKN